MNVKKIHVFRIMPGSDLLHDLAQYCDSKQITSAVIMGIIGSLEKARINYVIKLPAQFESVEYTGPLEIVSAQGTIALKGTELIYHIHMQVANMNMSTGGHLAQATVFSTAEVCLGELDYQIYREIDTYTGLNELIE